MDPQKLMQEIMAQSDPNSSEVGDLTNELLREFQRGYSLENLRPLLHSENERLLNTGIWIASELGEKGKPLLSDVSPLLSHPARRVRYFAIDCILLWAGPSNGRELALAVTLMEDNDSAVRWKAIDFLSRASREQLRAALSHLEVTEPKSTSVAGLAWLLGPSGTNPKQVVSALQSPNDLLRKYGAVAAARMFKENREPFTYAQSIDDPEIRRFTERYAATA
jgi:hypothetical protein